MNSIKYILFYKIETIPRYISLTPILKLLIIAIAWVPILSIEKEMDKFNKHSNKKNFCLISTIYKSKSAYIYLSFYCYIKTMQLCIIIQHYVNLINILIERFT